MGRKIKQNKKNLDVNKDTLFTLGSQDLVLNSVPERDRDFLVQSVNDPNQKQFEVRTVYNTDVTDVISDSLKEDAIRAAKILGSNFVGVDFITTSPTDSLEKAGGFINELNTTPGLHHHYNSKTESFPQAALQAISTLLE